MKPDNVNGRVFYNFTKNLRVPSAHHCLFSMGTSKENDPYTKHTVNEENGRVFYNFTKNLNNKKKLFYY